MVSCFIRKCVSISIRGNSYYSSLIFPLSASGGAGPGQHRTSKHCLCSARSLIHAQISPPPHVLSLFHFFSHRHLYSLHPNNKYHKEVLRRLCRACFQSAHAKEAITVQQGQIGWGSYLGRIMFDILHHYQLPPSPLQESYLSLADVPLSVMNFLCPPLASPRLAHPTSQTLVSCSGAAAEEKKGERGEEIKNKRR